MPTRARIKRPTVAVLTIALLSAGAATPAMGQDFSIFALTFSPGSMYTLNPSTGAATLLSTVTSFSGAGGNGLTRTPDGSLWYTTTQLVPGGLGVDGLVRLSADGASVLGTLPVAIGINTMLALASASDDTFHVVWRTGFDTGDPCFLSTVDRADGSVTQVGQLRTPQGFGASIQGADFGPDGTLFGWDTLRGLGRIDLTTGLVTDVDPNDTGPVMQSIAYGPDGFLYGATQGTLMPADSFGLYRINPLTGAIARIGGYGAPLDIRGIEIVPSPGAGVIALGAICMGLARRRR
jgi:streptogramin lyase